MSWTITLFFALLLLVIILMAVTTLQVNEFEKRAQKFVDTLHKRYDLEKLRSAYLKQLQNFEKEKAKNKK